MLTSKKIVPKLEAAVKYYEKLRFEEIAPVAVELLETQAHTRQEPAAGEWKPIKVGERWGGNRVTGWFRGDIVLPQECHGRRVFLHARTGGETLLQIDGHCRGVFDEFHHYVTLTPKGEAGHRFHVAFESYSGHSFPGTMPNDAPIVVADKAKVFDGVYLATERKEVSAFVYDVKTLLSLQKMLDANSLRKHAIIKALEQVWTTIAALPLELPEAQWRPQLATAREIMAPLLALQNSPTTPTIALVAHSHIDTAWLWPISETRRKTHRTYSSMVSLMERYPEVIFVQSSPYHAEMVRVDQPELFERMKALVLAGRWEPNGGAWIEPDCNLTSGESLVRQFLHGIQWTREHFNYSPDMFWQPDVFGYSAALPQILQGFNIKYFCTTKMAWNDTTRFPYDTFYWQGMDGSRVLSHLTSIPGGIDPQDLIERWQWAQHKDSETKRLAAYGWGDGGGGPTMESMEMIRRVADLEGTPRTYHTTVSDFMQGIDAERRDWPLWTGELYLELHRGTLTSVAKVKRGNRKTEYLLRDAEILHTMTAVKGLGYPAEELRALWTELLINQFHDILPGSSIAIVNDEAHKSFDRLQAAGNVILRRAAEGLAESPDENGTRVLLFNTLGWNRRGDIEIAGAQNLHPADPLMKSQVIEDIEGRQKLVVSGPEIPALGSLLLELVDGEPRRESPPFRFNGDVLETPFGYVRFDNLGRIRSYLLKHSEREVVREGGLLNVFHTGEDVPEVWDAWDIDAEQELRMKPETRLVSREIVSEGPVQLRFRSVWKIGVASTLVQDTIFHANSPQITFETQVDWQEKHILLKAGFDLDVLTEFARHEIQFGHVERPTHRNYPQDRAKFEVCCHKWTDLSDEGFGVAVLNDCKYGVSVNGTNVRLSLLKSGTHPDERADPGRHLFTYAILPHEAGFSVPAVVRPAYELNVPPIAVLAGKAAVAPRSLFHIDSDSVIVDTVKWAEEGDAFIVRLYEAGRKRSRATLKFDSHVTQVVSTNLLEENEVALPLSHGSASFYMTPFQIKTLKCYVKL